MGARINWFARHFSVKCSGNKIYEKKKNRMNKKNCVYVKICVAVGFCYRSVCLHSPLLELNYHTFVNLIRFLSLDQMSICIFCSLSGHFFLLLLVRYMTFSVAFMKVLRNITHFSGKYSQEKEYEYYYYYTYVLIKRCDFK